jgi:hypothetical protein
VAAAAVVAVAVAAVAAPAAVAVVTSVQSLPARSLLHSQGVHGQAAPLRVLRVRPSPTNK